MSQNIVEYLREEAVKRLFEIKTFSKNWPIWRDKMFEFLPDINARNILNLGDHMKSIFTTTSVVGRRQGDLSASGVGWEALICWYMNLCLLERRTVVIKHNKTLIPLPIREAITVKYDNIITSTESDLIAITFPDKPEYTTLDKFQIQVSDDSGKLMNTRNKKGKFNKLIIDALVHRDFNQFEIGIIQCKTNWNDTAQIPMLWDMIYSSEGFTKNSISVGTSAYSIKDVQRFTYSFVTVPTVKKDIKPTSIAVQRVRNLSGGNYWGMPSTSGVANSIKEIFGKNFSSGSSIRLLETLDGALSRLNSDYSYFKLLLD